MGKSTISMAIFNSYVKLPEGRTWWMSVAWRIDADGFISLSERSLKDAEKAAAPWTTDDKGREGPLFLGVQLVQKSCNHCDENSRNSHRCRWRRFNQILPLWEWGYCQLCKMMQDGCVAKCWVSSNECMSMEAMMINHEPCLCFHQWKMGL